MNTPIADLNNPTPAEVDALAEAFRAAPGVIQSGHDLAVIAFKHIAARMPPFPEGWLEGSIVETSE